jgi:hypothetical protein
MAQVNDYQPEGMYGQVWQEGMPRHQFDEEGLGFCIRQCRDCGFPCPVDDENWELRCSGDDGCPIEEDPWT